METKINLENLSSDELAELETAVALEFAKRRVNSRLESAFKWAKHYGLDIVNTETGAIISGACVR